MEWKMGAWVKMLGFSAIDVGTKQSLTYENGKDKNDDDDDDFVDEDDDGEETWNQSPALVI